jgi:aminopeptidase N
MRGLLSFLFLALVTNACTQTLISGGKLKPEQAIMDVRHYTIALAVNFTEKSINGYTTVDVIMEKPATTVLLDLMNDLTVTNVLVNNKKAAFTHANALITITPATTLPAGKASIKVEYGGKPHIAVKPPWEDGFSFTTDSTGHPWMAITAEGTGGKIYFPCKDHPSDEPNEGVDMIITTPKDLVAAGPGLLQKVTKQKNTATYFWKTRYPINNYSIIFNVGNYEVVTRPYTTINGNKVPMEFYVLKDHASKAQHHLEILEKIAHVKEKYFGEYPWAKEKIGIVETSHLGMEHQSMNAYGNSFKYTKVGGEDFDWLMNHEFGHEWWGNKVTAKDWADYWIHEGIGSFGDVLYTDDVEGKAAYIKHFKQSVYNIANTKPVVQGVDIDEESAYINDIYIKGAFFMHTLRYIIGDSIFFPTLKALSTDSQYTYNNLVNTTDVQKLFSKASGTNLQPLFDFYLYSTKKLEIHVTPMSNNRYQLKLDNFDMKLPVDVITDKGTQRLMLGKTAITITSTQPVQVDPDAYYLKRTIIE